MIHAYDKLYLEKARNTLGKMLDFAVYDLKYDIDIFFDLFITSGVAERFERGDADVVVGRSGIELTYEILEYTQPMHEYVKPQYTSNKSEEYWTGWALAYFQWQTGISFSQICKYVPLSTIRSLYSPYHEMDIRQFTDKMTELYQNAKKESNLKIYRQRAGLTQKQLSEFSGIPLRTIQQYEQQQKNLSKAQAAYLIKLSQLLSCKPQELLEIEKK